MSRRRNDGRGLSRQAWSLVPKIRDVDRLVRELPLDQRVFEVHPEVSFAAMTGEACPQPKRTWAGFHDRIDRLAAVGILLRPDLGPAGQVGVDDLVDAAAAAWSADRIARGTAITFPGAPDPTYGTRTIAIWA